MNIYEKHLKAIDSIVCSLDKDAYDLAKACETITKETTEEFAEWLLKSRWIASPNYVFWTNLNFDYSKTTSELFQEFQSQSK